MAQNDVVLTDAQNWASHSHRELYEAVHRNNDPGQTHEIGAEWSQFGTELTEAARVVNHGVAASEAGWTGAAADAARAALKKLANWVNDTAELAVEVGKRVQDQGQIMANARASMTEPVEFNVDQASGRFVAGGITGLIASAADVRAANQKAQAGHEHAVAVMTTMENESRAVDRSTPQFTLPFNPVTGTTQEPPAMPTGRVASPRALTRTVVAAGSAPDSDWTRQQEQPTATATPRTLIHTVAADTAPPSYPAQPMTEAHPRALSQTVAADSAPPSHPAQPTTQAHPRALSQTVAAAAAADSAPPSHPAQPTTEAHPRALSQTVAAAAADPVPPSNWAHQQANATGIAAATHTPTHQPTHQPPPPNLPPPAFTHTAQAMPGAQVPPRAVSSPAPHRQPDVAQGRHALERELRQGPGGPGAGGSEGKHRFVQPGPQGPGGAAGDGPGAGRPAPGGGAGAAPGPGRFSGSGFGGGGGGFGGTGSFGPTGTAGPVTTGNGPVAQGGVGASISGPASGRGPAMGGFGPIGAAPSEGVPPMAGAPMANAQGDQDKERRGPGYLRGDDLFSVPGADDLPPSVIGGAAPKPPQKESES